MTKSMKALACLGIVAGLGVAMLPLGAYADTRDQDTDEITINAKINESIAIYTGGDEAKDGVIEFKDGDSIVPNNDVAEKDGSIIIDSNASDGYHILIKEKGGTTSDPMKLLSKDNSATNTDYIESGTPAKGSSLWGIKLKTVATKPATAPSGKTGPVAGTDFSTSSYTTITGQDKKLAESDTRSADDGDTWDITVGITAAPNLTPDTYTGKVTVTAIAGPSA